MMSGVGVDADVVVVAWLARCEFGGVGGRAAVDVRWTACSAAERVRLRPWMTSS